ncbi:MAG TPA: major capsid family protein, partial [Candidatus Polarisedimenticolia bacterium]|nr:major capsid family protein [Candidatus Polarisedimenticolia bacterium]
GKQLSANVRSIGGSYGYSVQDIRRANMAGVPLEQRKANAARKANDQLTNSIAWFGDDTHGLQGLLYNANVTKAAATNGGWLSATADHIIQDVNVAIGNMISTTKGVETPDTVAIATKQFAHISSTPRTTGTDTTILEFLRRVWPGINFISVPEFEALAIVPSTGLAGPTDVMLIYRRSPDKLTLEIPQPYEQFPAQERNLNFVVPTHSRTGGVIVYYPLSVSVIDGLEV